VEGLFKIINTLIKAGKSIIFITHKLKEVLAVADDISVLRLGRMVGSIAPSKATPEKLASMMVGRDVSLVVQKPAAKPKEVVLKVEKLFVRDERQNLTVQDVSFDVRKGEVLGVAGVQGNGSIELKGKVLHHATPRQILENGVAHIPEDRQRHGLILSFPIHDNMVLCTYYKEPFARGVNIQEKPVFSNAEALVKEYDVRTPNIYVNAGALSGGNQQKVIINCLTTHARFGCRLD
jgi:general nucleoside transport system ATP-binding protein